MIEKLLELHKNSYVPISNYPVSAIVVTKDGKEYPGVNVEDASTRAGTCAERTAIFTALTAGVKKGSFKELHVMTSSTKTIGMPCFVCRQMISEVFDKDAKIICYNTNGESVCHTVEELCPYPFGEDDLRWNVDLLV